MKTLLGVSLLTSCTVSCHALVPSFVPSFTSRHHVFPRVASRTAAFGTDTDQEDSSPIIVNGDDEILSLLDIDASDDNDDREEDGDVLLHDGLLGFDAEEDEETRQDKLFMLEAINMARSSGGERSPSGK